MRHNINLKIEVLTIFFISILITSCNFQSFSTDDSTLLKNYSDTVKSIAIDSKGNIWLGSNSGGISKYKDKTLTVFDTKSGLISNYIKSITLDNKDNVWAGTDKGICRFDGTTWKIYTTSDGLVSNQINEIAIDKQNNIWIATTSGVSKFDGISWSNYTISNGLSNNNVTSVCIDLNNNKWFGTWGGGVSVLNDTTWYSMTTVDGLSSNYITKLAVSPTGKILYGSDKDGMTACAFDSKGKGWLGGVNKGIATINGNVITTYFMDYYLVQTYTATQINNIKHTINTGLSGNSIYDIKLDSHGNVWVGTESGISMFDGTKWTSSFSVVYK